MRHPSGLSTAVIIARLSLREAVRGRLVRAMGGCALVLLALFALACGQAMDAARQSPATAQEDLVGATLLGTSAFTVLLLGAFVAVFLTHGALRGDLERGMLQPLFVRPVSRAAVVLGRLAAGAGVAAAWTAGMWLLSALIMRVFGGWSAPAVVVPALALALAAALVAVCATAASSLAGPMAAGAGTLALVGIGFTFGLVAQLGATLGVADLRRVADVASAVLPFEALYRHVLHELDAGLGDLTRLGISTGPFGGAHAAGPWLLPWVGVWTALLVLLVVRRARSSAG